MAGAPGHLEEDVRRVHRLREALPEVGRGAASYDEVSVESDEVYAVVRRLGDARSVLLVNLSDKRLETTCAIDLEPPVPAGDGLLVFDAWNDRAIDVDLRYALDGATLRWLPLVFEPYQTRLLVLRPRCPR